MLYGEGNYALSAVKEVDGTEAFLAMDDKTKQCQNEETLQVCLTNEFLRKGLEECKCTPYSLRDYSKNYNI